MIFLLALVLAQATPVPSLSPAPSQASEPPGWTAVPPDKSRPHLYAGWQRREADGTQSVLTAEREVCDCQPKELIAAEAAIFGTLPGANIKVDSGTICDVPADRLLVTGKNKNGGNNIEVVYFRREPAIYTFMYTFRSDEPMPDAEKLFALFCPNSHEKR